jgi:predicted MFS family arabinose efflux permease
MIGDVLFIIGGILICSAFSYAQFVVGRIFMGGGAGIAAVVCAVVSLGWILYLLHQARS